MIRTVILNLIVFICFSSEVQASNVTYTDDGIGGYSFELFGGALASGITISAIVWDFNDGTVVSGGANLSAFHQYAYQNGVYDVEVTYIKDDNGTITNETETETVTIDNWSSPMVFPKASFNSIDLANWCGTGELTLGWSFCDESLGWSADYVVWNMGDGQTVTTQNNNAVVHIYESSGLFTVTAEVFFVGPNGETCSVSLFDIESAPGNPCSLLVDPSLLNTPYLEVEAAYAKPNLFFTPEDYCQTSLVNFSDAGGAFPSWNNVDWSYEVFVDGNLITSSSGLPTTSGFFFSSTLPAGDHLVELVYTYSNSGKTCTSGDGVVVTIDSCDAEVCDACNAFRPEPEERYWISAWVKEAQANQVKTYSDAHLKLSFTGGTPLSVDFFPTGDIIEGWQRIVGSFYVPAGSTAMDLILKNNGTVEAFYDDIRFHPFNASMKSYVYDPETLWLTAELDDNNFATFYEYDNEGQLVRIKKETSRGIMTIQESSSSNPKSGQ